MTQDIANRGSATKFVQQIVTIAERGVWMIAVGLPVQFDQSAQRIGQGALQLREPPLESALYLGLVVTDRRRLGEYGFPQDLFEAPKRRDRPSELLPKLRRMQMGRKQRRQGVESDHETLLFGRLFHLRAPPEWIDSHSGLRPGARWRTATQEGI